MIKELILLIENDYNIFITLLSLIILIWGIYNKIKFLCLQKASEMVAKAEGYNDLTGEEKFAIVITWINNDLPKVFRNSMIKTLIEKLVQFAYNTSFSYMEKYIKRKTGKDVSELLLELNEVLDLEE